MSAEIVKRRLFVGGLSEAVTEDELKDRFARFGNVSNLTFKTRNDEEGNHVKSFAHLDIQGTEESIKKCFSAYQNAKWKGSVMKLQDAKENFIERLQVEREEEIKRKLEPEIPEIKKSTGWKPPEFGKLVGAPVPGTPVPGIEDWVVGKYGRCLPILNVKKSYKTKAIKHDPSKFCHAAKVFKDTDDNDTSSTHCDTLTWCVDTPDSEITKKRKGVFPPSQSSKKPKPFPAHLLAKSEPFPSKHQQNGKANDSKTNNRNGDLEIVKVGQQVSDKQKGRSKFDSDYEDSDSEENVGWVNGKVNSVDMSSSAKKTSETKTDNSSKQTPKSTKKIDPKKADISLKESPTNSQTETSLKNGSSSKIDKLSKDRLKSSAKTNSESIKLSQKTSSSQKKEKTRKEEKMDEDDEEEVDDDEEEEDGDSDDEEEEEDEDSDDEEEEEDEDSDDEEEEEDGDSDDEEEEEEKVLKNTAKGKSKIPAFKGIGSLITKPPSEKLDKSPVKTKSSVSNSESSKGEGKKDSKKVQKPLNTQNKDDDEEEESDADDESSDADEEESSAGDDKNSDDEEKASTDDDDDSSEEEASSDDDDSEEENGKDEAKSGTKGKSKSSVNTPASKKSLSDSKLTKSSVKETASVIPTPVASKPSPKKPRLINADMSEFVAEAPDTASCLNGSSDDNSDSYDSDLDSSNFELVAKKLAQKAARDKGMAMNTNQRSADTSVWESGSNKRKMLDSNVSDQSRKNQKEATLEKGNKDGDVTNSTAVQNRLLTLAGKPEAKEDAKDSETSPQPTTCTKQEVANAKRLKAVQEKEKLRQRKKDWMRAALKNVDTASSKRIVFSSSEDDDDDADKKEEIKKKFQTEEKIRLIQEEEKKSSATKDLLGGSTDEESDDDEEEIQEMFKSKPQFEGKKGEKLMKMQKKFGDSRFKLDEKFLDSDDDDSDDDDEDIGMDIEKPVSADTVIDQETSLAEEKKRNLAVLESVVGKNKVDRLTAKLKRDNIKIVDMNLVRFDPTKIKQSQQVVQETKQTGSKPEVEEEEDDDKTQPSDSPVPTTEVKKSKVTLSDSLVDLMRTKKEGGVGKGEEKGGAGDASFSLTDMFGGGKEDKEEDMEVNQDWQQTSQKTLSSLLTSKPTDKLTSKTPKTKPVDKLAENEEEKEKKLLKTNPKSFMNLREEDEDDDDDSTDEEEDGEDKGDSSRVECIISERIPIDPVKEQAKILRDAGRVDIRFTKEEWLGRFSDIRHDLLQLCKKRYKDAKRRKKIEDEHKRKKAVLSKAGKGQQWWRKK